MGLYPRATLLVAVLLGAAFVGCGLVAWRHAGAGDPARLMEAVDPVCGMTLFLAGASETAVHDDVTYYFCSAGCRARSEADPEAALA